MFGTLVRWKPAKVNARTASMTTKTNDERRTRNDERRTTNDERRTTNDERRRNDGTNDEGTKERTTNDERRTTKTTTNDELRVAVGGCRGAQVGVEGSNSMLYTIVEYRRLWYQRLSPEPLPALLRYTQAHTRICQDKSNKTSRGVANAQRRVKCRQWIPHVSARLGACASEWLC